MVEQNHDEGFLTSMFLSLFVLPLSGSALELEGWLDMYDAADMKPTNGHSCSALWKCSRKAAAAHGLPTAALLAIPSGGCLVCTAGTCTHHPSLSLCKQPCQKA